MRRWNLVTRTIGQFYRLETSKLNRQSRKLNGEETDIDLPEPVITEPDRVVDDLAEPIADPVPA